MTEDLRDAVTLPEIIIAEYDPGWPAAFQRERARLVRALGDAIVSIEHIGSTAVPDLAAKPIIDIMVGVRELSVGERQVEPLETLDYVYCGEAGLPGRLFFRRGNPRSHHVHIVQHEGSVWERTIFFRDYLRQHSEAAAEYAKVKRELAARFRTDIPGYGAAKEPFVERMLAEARAHVKRNPHG